MANLSGDIEKVLLTREQIARRVAELGTEISGDLRRLDPDDEIVLIPILLGGMIFVADLVRELPYKIRLSVVTVSSYPGRSTESKGAQITGALPEDLHGRHVLIVDDILDSGETIRVLRAEVLRRGARSVRSCVLLRKTIPTAMGTACEYVGFDIADEFVVGYGLDYDNYYRNLPEVGVLRKDAM